MVAFEDTAIPGGSYLIAGTCSAAALVLAYVESRELRGENEVGGAKVVPGWDGATSKASGLQEDGGHVEGPLADEPVETDMLLEVEESATAE